MLQPDGKIVLAGFARIGRVYEFALARYHAPTVPVVSLSVSPEQVDEGDPVTVAVTLSPPQERDVTIPLRLRDGSAEWNDYSFLHSITISAGATTGTGIITTAQDADDDHETFTVSLGTPPPGIEAGSPPSVRVTIWDDEAPVPEGTTIWSATLTVQSHPGGTLLGCGNAPSGDECSSVSILTDDDFTYGGVNYTFRAITWSSSSLGFRLDNAIPSGLQSNGLLLVGVRQFKLADAGLSNSDEIATWTNGGLSWSAGDTVQLRLIDLPVDVTVWTPTLRVGGAGGNDVGCRNGAEGAECSAAGVLSDHDFTYTRTYPDLPGGEDARTYRVRELYRTDGNRRNELVLVATDQYGQSLPDGLVLTVLDLRNGNTVPLRFPLDQAVRRQGNEARWTYDGLPWVPGTALTLGLERPRAGLNSILVHYDGITDDAPDGVDGFRHHAAANPTTYGYTVRLPGEFISIDRDYQNNPVTTTHARLRIHPENPGSTLRVGGVTFDNNGGWSANSLQAVSGELSHAIELDKTNIYTHVSIEVTDGDVTKTYWLAIDPPPRTYRLTPEARVVEGQAAALTLTLSEPAPSGGAEFTVSAGYGTATAGDLGAIASPVTVTEGNTTVAIAIPTVDDEQYEGEESFTVSVAPARFGWGPDPDATDTATVTIQDNDPAPTGPEPRNVRVAPGDGSLTVTWTVAPREGVADGDIRHALRWSQEPGVWANPMDPRNVGKNDGVTVAGGVTSYLITGLKNDVATGVFVRSYTGNRHDEQSPQSSKWVRVKGERTTPRGDEGQQQQGGAPNRAPTVSAALANVTGLEVDGTREVSLSGVFTDADGDTLTITAASSDDTKATVSVASDYSKLTLAGVAVGTATITVTARDSDGNSVSDAFDAPVAKKYAGLIARMYEWRNDPQWKDHKEHTDRWDRALKAFGETVADQTLTKMTAAEAQEFADKGWTRWTPVTAALREIEAADQQDQQQQAAPNRAPTVSNAIADATIVNESGTHQVSLAGVFSDADFDNLTITAASSDETKATVSVAPGYLTLTVTAQAPGAATITVTAADGRGGTVDDTFTVTVKAAPTVVSAISDITGLEVDRTREVSLSGVFSDADGDALTITAVSSDETKATITVASDGSKLTLAGVAVGSATITVTAQDADGNTVSDTFDAPVARKYAGLIAQMYQWRNDPQWKDFKEHTDRWDRALMAFGEEVTDQTLTRMTAEEAQGYADQGWTRWAPVAAALREIEAGSSG